MLALICNQGYGVKGFKNRQKFLDNFGLNWYDHHARYFDPEVGRWWAIDPALQGASPYMAMGNNPMMYIDADGKMWNPFKAIGQAWNYAWDKASQFAQWADQVGIPSVNVGYGISSSGQIQPVGDFNGNPLFSNESQYEAASQNAVNAINDARGDYFSQQQMNANYSQQLNNKVMSIPSSSKGVGFLQVEGRIGFPLGEVGVTTSLQFGLIFDRKGNIAAYSTPTLGACSGGGAFTGVSWGVIPNANTISEVKGWGINLGFVYSAWGNSFALEGNAAIGNNDYRLGFTAGTRLSKGYGAMGYTDVSNTIFLSSGNVHKMSVEGFANFLNSNIPNSNYTPDDALQIFQFMHNLLP